jgi:hypothetical protein
MEEAKKISITGTANRYAIKKLINDRIQEKEFKKRVISEKWTFGNEYYNHINQLKILQIINSNLIKENKNEENKNEENKNEEISKIMIQEITKKIYNYKQQDLLKKKYNDEKFLKFDNVIKKLVDCELKCRYCDTEMAILYDISREMKQWSIDRIDNEIGHNNDNFHLACLDCNLKRRRRSDEKFLFTKKLNLIKQDTDS